MIGPANPFSQRYPHVFDGGMNSTDRKVTGLVLSLLAALASFLFLPPEGALIASVGIITFFSLFFCCPNQVSNFRMSDPSPHSWRRSAWGPAHQTVFVQPSGYHTPPTGFDPRSTFAHAGPARQQRGRAAVGHGHTVTAGTKANVGTRRNHAEVGARGRRS